MRKNNFSDSPYYPPRANFWSPIKHFFSKLRDSISFWHYRASSYYREKGLSLMPLILPCLGFLYAGKKELFKLSLLLYFASLIIFVTLLGSNSASYAFALMLFLHATSIIYYLFRVLGELSFTSQIILNIGVSIGVVYTGYYLLMDFLNSRLITPINYRGMAMVAVRTGKPKNTQIGDLIVFSQKGNRRYRENFYLVGGLNIGRVIAKGGDKVRFNSRLAITADRTFIKPLYYPEFMEITVPSNAVFVLTELHVQGNLTEGIRQNVAESLANQSVINDENYIGYIPRTWFGKRQYY